MNKDEIRDLFFEKQNKGESLTPEENQIALQFFSEEELSCLKMPKFNHESCFHKRNNQLPKKIYIRKPNTSSF